MEKNLTPEQRLKAQTKYFTECKEAYRSIQYSGVAEVKDKRKIPDGLKQEDEIMQEVQPDADVDMQDGQEGEMQVEEVEVEEMEVEENEVEEEIISLPKLHEGSYDMGPTSLRCLIYKVDTIDAEIFEVFRLLESVRHPALIRHHTFYEESQVPRVVLSWVDGMLKDLLKTKKASERFFMSEKGVSSLQTEFLTMILDICSGLEHLFSLGLYPPKIDLNDLYVCKDGPKYRVQLLVLKVDKLATKSSKRSRMTALWTQVRSIVTDIRSKTGADELSEVDKRFLNYIGKDVTMLAQYPLSWSYDQKGAYLISILSADRSIIRDKLKNSGLEWPKKKEKNKKTEDIPKLLELLIENDNKRTHPSTYFPALPFDYVRLSRTVYKHYPVLCKDVPELKDMCGKREDYLQRMEKWEPLIWCILFDAIGVIASL